MKVGEDLEHDLARLAFIREVIGSDAGLMLDANQVRGLEMYDDFLRKHTYPTGSVWVGREASGAVTFLP
jgi:L-alanine-DL-glutamate epimerase-like enolase superfamily enzyme